MNTRSITYTAFENRSFFLLPLKVNDRQRLDGFLQSCDEWEPAPETFDLNYVLRYAAALNRENDGRFTCWQRRSADIGPIYLFDHKTSDGNGRGPHLDSVSLFLFDTGVAFLEISVLYEQMKISEIAQFVYYFRSLRNSEDKSWLHFPEGKIGLATAIENFFPESATGTELCFHNPSDVKRQAAVFTVLDTTLCSGAEAEEGVKLSEEEISDWQFCLAHGFKEREKYDTNVNGGKFDFYYNVAGKQFWSGSQDGLVCITTERYYYQYKMLCADYRYLYLLLLHQRYASFSLIETLSDPEKNQFENHREVVELVTRYAFRVVSEDRYVQTVFSEMSRLLMLDELLQDLEDGNAQVDEIQRKSAEKKERGITVLLGAFSLLTFSSALIDLASYFDRFAADAENRPQTLFSLGINATIAVILLIVFVVWTRKLRRANRKKSKH